MLTNCHQLCTNLLISNNVLKPQEDTSLLENLMNCADASFSRQFHESVIFLFASILNILLLLLGVGVGQTLVLSGLIWLYMWFFSGYYFRATYSGRFFQLFPTFLKLFFNIFRTF